MGNIWGLLSNYKDDSFWDLINKKKNTFKVRASNNENIIHQFNSSIDAIYDIVKYFDEKNIELKKEIQNNMNLELSDTDYSKIEDIIRNYTDLIDVLENFKEWEPEINWIINSQQYRQFSQHIIQLNQNNNNQGIVIEKYNNEIDNVLNYVKIKVLYKERDELKSELNEAKSIWDIIIDKKDEINEALELTKSILEKKDININNEITEHYEFFENEANNNRWIFKKKKWFLNSFNPDNYTSFKISWLIMSIITWILTIFYIYLNFDKTWLTIWDSLLRISILTIAFYFIIFFSKQYNEHKNLDKSYTFKSISLKIMLWLSKIWSVSEKNMIYEKALDKIFSEPNVNKSNKEWDIINIIKDTIPTKIQTNIKDN